MISDNMSSVQRQHRGKLRSLNSSQSLHFCLSYFALVNILVPLKANGETFGLEHVLDQKLCRQRLYTIVERTSGCVHIGNWSLEKQI